MRILLASIFMICCASAVSADQGIDPNTTVTLTIGDINALIAAKIAEINAQNAMAKINAQVQKKVADDPAEEIAPLKPDSLRQTGDGR